MDSVFIPYFTLNISKELYEEVSHFLFPFVDQRSRTSLDFKDSVSFEFYQGFLNLNKGSIWVRKKNTSHERFTALPSIDDIWLHSLKYIPNTNEHKLIELSNHEQFEVFRRYLFNHKKKILQNRKIKYEDIITNLEKYPGIKRLSPKYFQIQIEGKKKPITIELDYIDGWVEDSVSVKITLPLTDSPVYSNSIKSLHILYTNSNTVGDILKIVDYLMNWESRSKQDLAIHENKVKEATKERDERIDLQKKFKDDAYWWGLAEEKGYSRDDINEAFDGDPSAIWNVD